MDVTRLSTKGQIILPKTVRNARGWAPGTEFTVEQTPDGVLLRPARPVPETRLEDVAGCLAWRGKPKTIAQMDRAVAREIQRRHDRGRY